MRNRVCIQADVFVRVHYSLLNKKNRKELNFLTVRLSTQHCDRLLYYMNSFLPVDHKAETVTNRPRLPAGVRFYPCSRV